MNKRQRRAKRRADNDAMAREARYWLAPRSADRLGHDKPVNRQAAKELAHKPRNRR